MKFNASQIAQFLNGEVIGNPEVTVSDIAKIEEAKEGSLTFVSNPKYLKYLYETEASIVLVNKDISIEKEITPTLIKVENAYESLAGLLELYVQSLPQKNGIEQPSFIHPGVEQPENLFVGAFAYVGEGTQLGKSVKIHPQVWIGENVEIGHNVTIFAGAKIYPGCKIGNNCTIHAGAVIGSDGFGFAPQEDGTYKKLHQIGIVVIEDNVEVGANTVIDCATTGATIVKKGAKLDNLIQIAHNCEIGENTVIAAQTGIAGSTKVGKNCMFGGQVGINGHITIGNNVNLAAKTGVVGDIKDGLTLIGAPAFEIGPFRRSHIIYRKLPEMYRELREVIKKVDKLNP